MHQAPTPPHHKLKQALFLGLLLLLTNCAVGPVIESSYNSSANFRVYQSFAWHKAELPAPLTGSEPAYSPLLDQQIKLAIESELVKEGLRPEPDSPDLLVAYDIALPQREAPEADTTFAPGFGYGYSYWYGYRYRYDITGMSGYRSIAELPPGTLVIDLIDATTNQLVWRGWYEANVDPTAVAEYDLNKAVANVMSRYPPIPDNVE